MTSTQAPPVQADPTTTEAPELSGKEAKQQQRAARVDAAAQKLLRTYRIADQKLPPAQRRSEQQLWKAAKRQAEKDETAKRWKQGAKDTVRRGTDTAYSEVKSALHRNRKQLAPWALAAPYAAYGASAWALAAYGSGEPIAISAAVAATATGAGILAWKKKIATQAPKAFMQRIKATIAVLTAWATLMPLIPSSGQVGMWLALIAGVGYMGLSWWNAHQHPLPAKPIPAAPATAPVTEQQPVAEPDSQADLRINSILHAWNTKVAHAEKGSVPGSSLTYVQSTDAVDRYQITLDDEGTITRKTLRSKHEQLALSLGVLEQNLHFEDTDHPAKLIMRHLVGEPVTDYDGPVVLCNGTPIHSRWEITPGATVDIVYGYYTDGEGMASYRVIDAGSVNSQFVLGGTGSGKTRLLEIVAIGLRFIGAYIMYVDGQDGASSSLLNEHADWVVSCDGEGLEMLLGTLASLCKKRNADLRKQPKLENEYRFDPQRPPVILLAEEGHAAFCRKRTKQRTYGQDLGEFAVQIRKLGVGFVAASQDFDLVETFGNSAKLRSSMLATNNFAAMRLIDKSRIGMLPSSCPKLDTIPPKGFGFSPFGERPTAFWRTPNLDGGTRHKRDWMTEYPAAPAIAKTSEPEPADEKEEGSDETASAAPAGVLHFPGATATTTAAKDDAATAAPTAAEQRVLDLLNQEPQHTPATAATALALSPQSARKHLRNLAAKGLVAADGGEYVAVDPDAR